jgi:hypothetical protein
MATSYRVADLTRGVRPLCGAQVMKCETCVGEIANPAVCSKRATLLGAANSTSHFYTPSALQILLHITKCEWPIANGSSKYAIFAYGSRGIAQRVPSNRGLPMNKKSRSNRKEDVQRLQLALERPWQSRDGSNVTYLHTSGAVVHLNQSLLARLEAENARLRGSVVDLFLQIRASRDGSTSRNRF